jgi:hypothetical protein
MINSLQQCNESFTIAFSVLSLHRYGELMVVVKQASSIMASGQTVLDLWTMASGLILPMAVPPILRRLKPWLL